MAALVGPKARRGQSRRRMGQGRNFTVNVRGVLEELARKCARQLFRDIRAIGDDREAAKLFARARNGGGGGAGIQNDYLALANHAHGRRRNAQFIVTVQPFFFLQAAVLQSAGAQRQSAPVGALKLPLMMQKFQILADGDQGRFETVGQIANHDTTVAL